MDDILIVDKFPRIYMEMVRISFTVNPLSIEEPQSYLGDDVVKLYYTNGAYAWTIGYKTYLEHFSII